MIEVWGRTMVVRYANSQLSVVSLRANDEGTLHFMVRDLSRLRLGISKNAEPVMLLYFRSPDFVVDGARTQHHPVPVFLDAEMREQAEALIQAVQSELLEMRRIAPRRPDLSPPKPLVGADGPIRPDVDAAAARMHSPVRAERIAVLREYTRLDEHYLELALAWHKGVAGILAISTVQVLFMAREAVHAFPVAFVDGVEVLGTPENGPVLRVSTGVMADLEFPGEDAADIDRCAQALRLVCEIDAVDGSIAWSRPSSADLFAEWQLLVERRTLGMVDDADFERRATGILLAMPN
ncbi:hypothetical protein AB0L25_27000 [Spirillospora sp. NPDC052242]